MDKIITLAELLKELDKYKHKELHVHHTWQPDHKTYSNKPDGLYWQKAMREFHVKTNGWSDIGQHVTLLPDGLFVTGRPFNKNPASISGYNAGAFAVEMIGNFDKGKDKLEGKQKESIIGLARYFDSKGRYIRFHRENSAKTCPGSGIDKAEFMAEVRRDNVLKKGDKGDAVKFFQGLLLKAGYDLAQYGADGSFGSVTEKAVETLQGDVGLPKTGRLDIYTLIALIERTDRTDGLQREIERVGQELARYKDFFAQLKSFI